MISTINNPNLGGMTLSLVAKDDAKFVHVVRVSDILNGTYAMPFLHVWFALDYFRTHNSDYTKKLELLFTLSRFRNHRVMRKVNSIIATREGKKPFTFTVEMTQLDIHISKTVDEAKALGINPSKYLDESTDDDDVPQCSNDWCLNQNTTCGKAADNVQIITDLDGVDWFVLIVRQNGPGRSQLAWAGGFVDKGETFKAAALREKDEETEVTISGNSVQVETTITELAPVKLMDWDPRAKFVEGMEVGAVVTHHVFKSS